MDPATLRSSFPVLERIAYCNAGSNGPVPSSAVDAARAELDAQLERGRTLEHFARRAELQEQLRARYAALLACEPGAIALTTSTSEGLGRVLAGLDSGKGDEILTSDQEHPGLIGPLLAARARGATIRTAPLATLADHVDARTTAVACSHVGWLSGELADPALADLDIPVILDGAQGAGAVPVDVHALGCAAYAGAGQKWLCGADGTGMLYLDPAMLERVTPLAPSYGSFADAANGLGASLHVDARRHDAPALSGETLAFSVAAHDTLAAAGWPTVYQRAITLAGRLAAELGERGRRVGPRGDTTLVSWEDPEPTVTRQRLADTGVVVRDLPNTPYLRASIGAWNDDEDLERLLAAAAPA